ncbi:MAG: peptidylprolyl isomerase [Candidatus Micrarchaeota archaeon]
MKLLAVFICVLLLFGCASQEAPKNGKNETSVEIKNETLGVDNLKAQLGDSVAVDYVGTLENGTVFDTSIKGEAKKANLPLRPEYSPLEFTIGAGQMIKGFDGGVVGMKVGEEKTVTLKPIEAYGEVNNELVIEIPSDKLPVGVEKGSQLMTSNGMAGVVLELDNKTAKVDFNHPLAGKTLKFKIIMRKITKASS